MGNFWELLRLRITESCSIAYIKRYYKKAKAAYTNQEKGEYFCAVDTYEKLTKHLNIDQIYIDGRAFIVESEGTEIGNIVRQITNILESQGTAQAKKKSPELREIFRNILEMLDTKRDRDVFEAIVTKLTNVNSVVSMKGGQFKKSVRNLNKFETIQRNCETVRNDMTVAQQHACFRHERDKSKAKNLKLVAEGRGRKLKCDEFPELAQ